MPKELCASAHRLRRFGAEGIWPRRATGFDSASRAGVGGLVDRFHAGQNKAWQRLAPTRIPTRASGDTAACVLFAPELAMELYLNPFKATDHEKLFTCG